MKTKILVLGFLTIFLTGCFSWRYSPEFAPKSTIQEVTEHRVAVATYYEMYEQDYLQKIRKIKQVKNYQDIPIFIEQNGEKVTVAYLGGAGNDDSSVINPVYYTISREEYLHKMDRVRQNKDYRKIERVPIFVKKDEKTGLVTISYLGAGAIIKDNHILTVNHLFDEENYYNYMYIWVFKEGIDHPIKAELVARTKCELIAPGVVHYYDYAMIHMDEDLGLPGLKIAEPDALKMGEKVIFTGSTGGFAFFSRFGYITQLDKYFQEDYDGKWALTSWEKFPFWAVYPGGPGDSGGPVTNIKAEIVTMMYCGVTNYSEEYIFGNPTQIIWDFLKEFKLEHLAR